MNVIDELLEWFQSLPADFAFLLALPFVVGAAGLAAEWYRGAQGQARHRAHRAPSPVHPSKVVPNSTGDLQ